MTQTDARPRFVTDDADPVRVRLAGQWTIATALQVAERLREIPAAAKAIDATGIVLASLAAGLVGYAALTHPTRAMS